MKNLTITKKKELSQLIEMAHAHLMQAENRMNKNEYQRAIISLDNAITDTKAVRAEIKLATLSKSGRGGKRGKRLGCTGKTKKSVSRKRSVRRKKKSR